MSTQPNKSVNAKSPHGISNPVTHAKRARKALLIGQQMRKDRVIWRTTSFRRPVTMTYPKNPTYSRRAVPRKPRLDQYSIIRYPLTTEKAMRVIEQHNTLVFIVALHANKPQIKEAITKLYGVKVMKVNTLIRPDGKKKAYVRLTPDHEAVDVANRIGII